MPKTVKNQVLTYNVLENYVKVLSEKFDGLHIATCGKSLLGKDIHALVMGKGKKNILYVGEPTALSGLPPCCF